MGLRPLLLLLALAGTATAVADDGVASTTAVGDVQVEADLRPAYLQGQPLLITLRARSASGSPASFPDLTRRPHLVKFELEHNGYWTNEIHDTYRPTAKHEVGHADTSLFGYLEAVEGAFDHYMSKAGEPDYDSYFKKHI